MPHTYILYISAVKISALTQAINFLLFNKKLFNAINTGAEPRVGHPTYNCCFCLFFIDKKCIYSVAERLYDHINPETFQTRAPASLQWQARVKRAWKPMRANGLYQFLSKREINYEHAMLWSVKAWSYQKGNQTRISSRIALAVAYFDRLATASSQTLIDLLKSNTTLCALQTVRPCSSN